LWRLETIDGTVSDPLPVMHSVSFTCSLPDIVIASLDDTTTVLFRVSSGNRRKQSPVKGSDYVRSRDGRVTIGVCGYAALLLQDDHFLSCTRTTLVASPAHPRLPVAVTMYWPVGSMSERKSTSSEAW
jgi:hypothetical protein